MFNRFQLISLVIISLIVLNCSSDKSEEQDQEESMVSERMNKAMEEMKLFFSDEKTVEPINYHDLCSLMPQDIGQLEQKSSHGENTSLFGMHVSEAEVKYISPEELKTLTIKITDMGNLSGFTSIATFAWTLTEFERINENGFERTCTFRSYKAVESYDKPARQSELQILVMDRFVIELKGFAVSTDQLHQFAELIDFEILEEMVKDSQ